jgi:hypothetical protein
MSAIEDLLRANRVHDGSQLWNVVTGLAEHFEGRPAVDGTGAGAESQRHRARRRIVLLRAKAASTTFPEEAALFQAKADELASFHGLRC